jgi:hypothetical protein
MSEAAVVGVSVGWSITSASAVPVASTSSVPPPDKTSAAMMPIRITITPAMTPKSRRVLSFGWDTTGGAGVTKGAGVGIGGGLKGISALACTGGGGGGGGLSISVLSSGVSVGGCGVEIGAGVRMGVSSIALKKPVLPVLVLLTA